MAETTTTVLYVIVLAGWFLLMCIVLRCCSGENEAQSMLDFDQEINVSAFSELHPKPLVCVDGELVRFARVQPLNTSSTQPTECPDEDPGGTREMVVHTQGGILDRLEVPSADATLPSAQAVWSPILALRTFVEPLTTAASAAFRNFQVSFHEQESAQIGSGERTATAVGGDAVAGNEENPADRGESRRSCTAIVVAAEEARSAVGFGPGTGVELGEFGHDRSAETKLEAEIEVGLRGMEV